MEAESYCLDSNGDTLGKAIIGYSCHGQGGNQVNIKKIYILFHLTKAYLIEF